MDRPLHCGRNPPAERCSACSPSSSRTLPVGLRRTGTFVDAATEQLPRGFSAPALWPRNPSDWWNAWTGRQPEPVRGWPHSQLLDPPQRRYNARCAKPPQGRRAGKPPRQPAWRQLTYVTTSDTPEHLAHSLCPPAGRGQLTSLLDLLPVSPGLPTMAGRARRGALPGPVQADSLRLGPGGLRSGSLQPGCAPTRPRPR